MVLIGRRARLDAPAFPLSQFFRGLACVFILLSLTFSVMGEDADSGVSVQRSSHEHLLSRFNCLIPRELEVPVQSSSASGTASSTTLPGPNKVLTCFITDGPIWMDSLLKECAVEDNQIQIDLPGVLADNPTGPLPRLLVVTSLLICCFLSSPNALPL